jgi:hypothetical protein
MRKFWTGHGVYDILRAHEPLPSLPQGPRRQALRLRLLRCGDLRHEAAAVLLGYLPVQGEAGAGEGSEAERGDMSEILGAVVGLIRAAKIDLSSEKRAQADVERVLTAAGVEFLREEPLSATDIVDFLVGGIALELKLRGARKKEVYKQLCRYARNPRVETILLASNMSMGLPSQIEGKDAYFVKLGEAWL